MKKYLLFPNMLFICFLYLTVISLHQILVLKREFLRQRVYVYCKKADKIVCFKKYSNLNLLTIVECYT